MRRSIKSKAASRPVAAEIENRQDQVLQMLDELNDRLERALAECGVTCEPSFAADRGPTPLYTQKAA